MEDCNDKILKVELSARMIIELLILLQTAKQNNLISDIGEILKITLNCSFSRDEIHRMLDYAEMNPDVEFSQFISTNH